MESSSSDESSIFSVEGGFSSGEMSSSPVMSSESSGEISESVEVIGNGISGGESESTTTIRDKCIGRHNKVSWGYTSVIGRRPEMEDAVSVVPGFVSSTCSHVGGCTAPSSSTSLLNSPLHFFAVFDGHGGPEVLYHLLVKITIFVVIVGVRIGIWNSGLIRIIRLISVYDLIRVFVMVLMAVLMYVHGGTIQEPP